MTTLLRSGRRAVLLVTLVVTASYGAFVWHDRATRPARWVGKTECGWTGGARVVVRSGLRPIDSLAAEAHERVHASQCAALGPVRYRWRNLFGLDKLALEVPAYCAGARTRARFDPDTAFLRGITTADLLSALTDVVDSAVIVSALAAECPEYADR